MTKYDMIVIGFGKGGKTLALKAAQMGEKVALIERSSQMYGGACINTACLPSKKLLHLSKDSKNKADKNENFKEAMSEKNALIQTAREKNYEILQDSVDVINATASFIDKETIIVKKPDGTSDELSATNFIINTGSIDKEPDFQIDSDIVFTSQTLLDISNLPDHLIIIGSGFVGLEFASIFANFGSKVTIISKDQEILKNEDDDIRQSVISVLKTQNIEIINQAEVTSIKENIINFRQNQEDKSLSADAFLLAIGRVANIEELELYNASVAISDKGNIIVNEFLQTSEANIYAIGDVKGADYFTHISLDDYRIVFDQLFGKKSRSTKNRSIYAKVLFLDTPFARVGVNLKQAKEQKLNFKELKISAQDITKAKILSNNQGFLKAIINVDNGEILGCSFHCIYAEEIINEIVIAMGLKANVDFMKNQIFTHPSVSEALNELFSQF